MGDEPKWIMYLIVDLLEKGQVAEAESQSAYNES